MSTNVKFNMDITPFLVQILVLRAELKTYMDVSLNDEQKKKFSELFSKNLNKTVQSFGHDFPEIVPDVDSLLKEIE